MARLCFFIMGIITGVYMTNKYDFNKIKAEFTKKDNILEDPEFKRFMKKMKKIEKQMQKSDYSNNDEE
eukprot:gene11201-4021_t